MPILLLLSQIFASDTDVPAFALDFDAYNTDFVAFDADISAYDADVAISLAFTPLVQFLIFSFRFCYCCCRHDITNWGLAVYRSAGSIKRPQKKTA